MLSNTQGKMICRYVPDYVVFDLETTGLSTETEEVIEISAVKVIGGQVVDEFSTLVNPGRHIPYQASSVNGIVDDMVADSPDFETAFGEFNEFIGDMVLVGHNARSFDLKFLYRDAVRFWGRTLGNDYIDTVLLSRALLPGMSHTLGNMAMHYGISTEGAHRALNDCIMTQQVFERLKNEIEHPAPATPEFRICPRCGGLVFRKNGRYGEFWGCLAYPDCGFTENS